MCVCEGGKQVCVCVCEGGVSKCVCVCVCVGKQVCVPSRTLTTVSTPSSCGGWSALLLKPSTALIAPPSSLKRTNPYSVCSVYHPLTLSVCSVYHPLTSVRSSSEKSTNATVAYSLKASCVYIQSMVVLAHSAHLYRLPCWTSATAFEMQNTIFRLNHLFFAFRQSVLTIIHR